MRIRRQGRIDLAEADRLVTGAPAPPEHRGLSVLLAAAAAAPLPEELADERAAVAGFTKARRDAGSATTGVDRRPAIVAAAAPASAERRRTISTSDGPRPRVPLPRAAMVKVAVGLAVAATGGTAFAAATGSLPTGIQQQAHELLAPLGVPAPSTSTRLSSTRPRTTDSASAGPGQAGTSPSPGASGRTGEPGGPQAAELCRAWEAAQQRQHGRPLTPPQRRALAALAGGEQNIPAFCAAVLAGQPGQQGQASPSDTATPRPDAPTAGRTHPGGGGGDQKGNGHATDQPRKTHAPHTMG